MKKKRGLTIKINLSNRWLYTFIALGILLVISVGVYAATYTESGAGHPITEISTCGANKILKMDSGGTAWTCGDEADPNVASWAKPASASPPVVSKGLYGRCESSGSPSNTCYTQPGYGPKEPGYCNGDTCACRAGYEKVKTGASGSNVNTHDIYACYKN